MRRERYRAIHRIDSIERATKVILERPAAEAINPNAAAVAVANHRIREIGDLRRFRRSGDDRN